MLLLRRLRLHTTVFGNPFVAYAVLLAVLCLVSIWWPNDTDLLTSARDRLGSSFYSRELRLYLFLPAEYIYFSIPSCFVFSLDLFFQSKYPSRDYLFFPTYFHLFLLFPTHAKGCRYQQHRNNIYSPKSILRFIGVLNGVYPKLYTIVNTIYNLFNTVVVYIRIARLLLVCIEVFNTTTLREQV